MARVADKPGSYRVKLKDGQWTLKGLRLDGTRVTLPVTSLAEGESLAGTLGFLPNTEPAKVAGPDPSGTVQLEYDEDGLPKRVDFTKAAAINDSLGVPPVPPVASINAPVASINTPPVDKEKKLKTAMSLMELTGIGWAGGTVALSRKLTIALDKEPVNPSQKQVKDLSESAKDTLIDWFGDKEIKPWQMTILLTLAIPLAMVVQSPRKPKEEKPALPTIITEVPAVKV